MSIGLLSLKPPPLFGLRQGRRQRDGEAEDVPAENMQSISFCGGDGFIWISYKQNFSWNKASWGSPYHSSEAVKGCWSYDLSRFISNVKAALKNSRLCFRDKRIRQHAGIRKACRVMMPQLVVPSLIRTCCYTGRQRAKCCEHRMKIPPIYGNWMWKMLINQWTVGTCGVSEVSYFQAQQSVHQSWGTNGPTKFVIYHSLWGSQLDRTGSSFVIFQSPLGTQKWTDPRESPMCSGGIIAIGGRAKGLSFFRPERGQRDYFGAFTQHCSVYSPSYTSGKILQNSMEVSSGKSTDCSINQPLKQ